MANSRRNLYLQCRFYRRNAVFLNLTNLSASSQLKDILEKNGWKNPVTREFSSAQEVLVRVAEFSNDAKGLSERMKQAIETEIPDNHVVILQSEAVGPGVGETLRWNFLMAIIIALFAILIYIAVRFWSFAYAAGAIVALIHDPLAILGIFLYA